MATGTIQIIQNDRLDKWYLTDGLTESDVIAAYQFVGKDWVDSKININDGTKYELSGTNFFATPVSGVIIPPINSNGTATYIDNSTLRGLSNINSCVYSIAGTNMTVGNCPGVWLANSIKWLGIYDGKPYLGTNTTTLGTIKRRGVLGANFTSSKLYFDGANLTLNTTGSPYRNNFVIFGRCANDLGNQCGGSCTAMVFYNKELTMTQHKNIATNIANLGGIL